MSENTNTTMNLDTLPEEGGTLLVEHWRGTIQEGATLYPFGKRGFDRKRALLMLGMAKHEVEHLGWSTGDFCNGSYLTFEVLPVMSIEELLQAEKEKGYAVVLSIVEVWDRDTGFELKEAYFPSEEASEE